MKFVLELIIMELGVIGKHYNDLRINKNKSYVYSEYVKEANLSYLQIYDGKGNDLYIQYKSNGTVNLIKYNSKTVVNFSD